MVKLSIRCSPDQAELVLAELLGLAPDGVEEHSGGDWVEYSIYGAPGELPEIGEVQAAFEGGLVEVRATEVAEDWADRWKEFHRPVIVESDSGRDRVWVGAPWHERPDAGHAAITIDPGRAFGTGAHPTTRLCLGLMLDLRERDLAVGGLSDVGTGSGVLAIAGQMFGWRPVCGLDHEVASVEAAAGNAHENSVEVDFIRHDLRTGLDAVQPTVVANLTAPLLGELAAGLPTGNLPLRIVCSGLVDRESEKVTQSFGSLGYELVDAKSLDGWTGLLLEMDLN